MLAVGLHGRDLRRSASGAGDSIERLLRESLGSCVMSWPHSIQFQLASLFEAANTQRGPLLREAMKGVKPDAFAA